MDFHPPVESPHTVNGSPLSGGYAGAKATQRFITGYAQEEAKRAGLDITFTMVLPQFAPTTGVGRAAVKAYAARAGDPVERIYAKIDVSSRAGATLFASQQGLVGSFTAR